MLKSNDLTLYTLISFSELKFCKHKKKFKKEV